MANKKDENKGFWGKDLTPEEDAKVSEFIDEALADNVEREVPAYLNNEVQALSESKQESTIGGNKTAVKVMSPVTYTHDEVECRLVATVEAPLKGYLVSASKVEDTHEVQYVDLSQAFQVYDWSNELAFLYPDIETVRQNVLRSFWRAGALHLKDLENNMVRRNLFGSAYPYKLP